MVKVTQLFPKALSPRPRGRADEETCAGDAPEEREAYPSGYGSWEQCKRRLLPLCG